MGKVIGFDRFKQAREKLKNEKRVRELKESLTENERLFADSDAILDKFYRTYGACYHDIGDSIDERLNVAEVDLDDLQEKFHSPQQVRELEDEIKGLNEDYEQWEAALYNWELAQDSESSTQIELLKLLGEQEFRQLLFAKGWSEEDVDATVDYCQRALKNREQENQPDRGSVSDDGFVLAGDLWGYGEDDDDDEEDDDEED